MDRRGAVRPAARGGKAAVPGGLRRLIVSLTIPVRCNPGRTAAIVGILTASGVFGWNLLVHQPNRHPAPLLASRDPAGENPPAPPPLPVPRPDIAAVGSIGAAGPGNAARVAATADPIGGLIRASQTEARPAEGRTAEASTPRVAAAQRALLKLGYGPLKPDGVLGTGTRQAVERFERTSNLPVTGTLSARTVKRLAQSSGLAIE